MGPNSSMRPRYLLQLLFCEKSKNVNNSTTTEDREKISKDLESSELKKRCMLDYIQNR